MSHLQLVLWALPRQGYPAVLGGPGKCARICDENVLMCLKNEHSIISKNNNVKYFRYTSGPFGLQVTTQILTMNDLCYCNY